MSVTPSISPLSVSESNDKLSPCSVSPSVSTVELSVSSTSIKNSGHVSFACVSIKSSVCPVLIKKSVIESFVCPVPINESEGELSTCPVPINGFDFERPPIHFQVVCLRFLSVPSQSMNLLSAHSVQS